MAGQTFLVTGGRGFLGRYVVNKLLEKGGVKVKIVDIAPELMLDEQESSGLLGRMLYEKEAEYISADVRSSAQLIRVFQGVNVVFHIAAPSAAAASDFKLQYDVNVTGTKNVIDACLKNGVQKLIYTSSASFVFDGIHGIQNGDESLPYPEKPMDHYTETKAQAEALVLNANGRSGLLTCALRPSGIFGPGDPLLLPKIAMLARQGKMKFTIGNGQNKCDFTFVENVAHGHLCAESHLVPGAEACGKPFFITNGEPRPFWGFLFDLLLPLGYPGPSGKIPAEIILPLAHANEQLGKILNYKSEFSPSRIRNATTWRTFSSGRAAKLIGYAPPIPLEEGIARTVKAGEKWRNVPNTQSATPSKAHRALGGGRVADVLLWRDLKLSAGMLVAFLLVYYFLFGGKYRFLQLVATMAFYTVMGLFIYSLAHKATVALKMGTLPEVPLVVVPANVTTTAAEKFRQTWNSTVAPALKKIITGQDFIFIAKAIAVLYVVSWIGTLPLRTMLLVTIFLSFAIPILYELNEEHVDKAVVKAQEKAISYKNIAAGHVAKYKEAAVSQISRYSRG
eukprot:TRINITY_DN4703_c0_g1_i2.p1 TRINITY_DN4703_c0_g1~~TRINITY_DN4703_c0_g1_i2.p1  ORF type:complete len:564 (-),score=109.67 TRINITY_DN4703_c0_g1_i2:286-1977(-)